MSIIKKPVIIGIYLVVICLFVSACGSNKINDNSENIRFGFDKNEVKSVSISDDPRQSDAVITTDKNEISSIIDYFSSLTTTETKADPSSYRGGGYTIRLKMKNGEERIFSHSGNMFFSEYSEVGKNNYVRKFTYSIPYEEAIKFDTIFANISEEAQRKRDEPLVSGTIISLNTESESGGRDISCVIKDKNNKTHDVFVQDAKIINSTGEGWIILHEKDAVDIYYKKDKKTDIGSLIATTVYILKSEYKP